MLTKVKKSTFLKPRVCQCRTNTLGGTVLYCGVRRTAIWAESVYKYISINGIGSISGWTMSVLDCSELSRIILSEGVGAEETFSGHIVQQGFQLSQGNVALNCSTCSYDFCLDAFVCNVFGPIVFDL